MPISRLLRVLATLSTVAGTLTLVAISVGVVIVWQTDRRSAELERRIMRSLDAARAWREVAMLRAANTLRQPREAADLEEPFRKLARHTNRVAAQIRAIAPQTAHARRAGALAAVFSLCGGLRTRIEDWAAETRQAEQTWQRLWKETQLALRQAKEAAHRLEGQHRVRRALQIRAFRSLDGEAALQLARQIIGGLPVDRAVVSAARELADLAVMVQELQSETSIAGLDNLKDNEIRLSLRRLHQAALRHAALDGGHLARCVAQLQETLFGKGAHDDLDHQTLVLGEGGFYRAHQRRLLLGQMGRRLSDDLVQLNNRLIAAERELIELTYAVTKRLRSHSHRVLAGAWVAAGLIGTVLVVCFSWLARRLERRADRIESALRASKRRAEETAHRLRQQQAKLERQRNLLVRINRELEAAKQAAEAADRSKSEFLANMSHELRTPMTAVLGYAEVLLDWARTQEAPHFVHEALEIIQRNGNYLLHIINDILDLSKIEAGKLEVERTHCDLRDLCADLESLIQVRTRGKPVSFRIRLESPVPATIQSDPTRLRQILINLLANAVKFTDRGHVELVIRVRAADQEPKLEFDVVDTGCGIDPARAEALFEPFTQADSSTTRRYGGTGLGLAISRRLARLLGGNLFLVHSRPGHGSRFRLVIPITAEELNRTVTDLNGPTNRSQPKAATPAAAATTTSPAERLAGVRVLLVDDAKDNQKLIAHFLRKEGAEVTVRCNGRDGVQAALDAAAAGSPFDVILMDMQMPVLDGYAATRTLRQQGYRGLIIALTAHAMAGERDRVIAAGCDDYATKPINRARLVEIILRHLPQPATSATGRHTHS